MKKFLLLLTVFFIYSYGKSQTIDSVLSVIINNNASINSICGDSNQLSASVSEIRLNNQYHGYTSTFGFPNADYGLAIKDSNKLMLTTDKGSNWNEISTPNSQHWHNAMLFYNKFNTNTWWMVKDSCYYLYPGKSNYKSVDGGLTWLLDPATVYFPISMCFISVDTGYYSSVGNTLFKTTNGGNTWNLITVPILNGDITKIVFKNNKIGFAIFSDLYESGDTTIIKTIDGGNTWTSIYPNIATNSFVPDDIALVDNNLILSNKNKNYQLMADINTLNFSKIQTNVKIFKLEISNNIGIATGNGDSYGNNASIFKSIDKGLSWKLLYKKQGVGFVQPCILSSSKTIVIGNEFAVIDDNILANFQWSPTSSLNNSVIPNPKAAPTNTTKYTITASKYGFQPTVDTVSINVSPLTIQASVLNPMITCRDSANITSNTNANGTAKLSYNWAGPYIVDNTLANIFVKPIQTSNYSVTLTNGSTECSATIDNGLLVSLKKKDSVAICVAYPANNDWNCQLVWNRPIDQPIDKYYIYRESSTNVFNKIDSLPYIQSATYTDPNSHMYTKSYSYKISFKDECGIETNMGPVTRTMHLTINIGSGINLVWSPYVGKEVSNYYIYRAIDSSSSTQWQLLDSVQGSSTTFTDLYPPANVKWYFVSTRFLDDCTPNKSSTYTTTQSNVVKTGSSSISENNESIYSIYPNPTTEKVIINCEGLNMVDVIDLTGRLIQRYEKIDQNLFSININQQHNGLYFIKLYTSKGTYVEKVIKK